MNHITNINLSNSDWNTTSEDLIVTGVYEEKTLMGKNRFQISKDYKINGK